MIFFKVITTQELRDTSDWLGLEYFEVSAKDYRTLNYMINVML